MFYSWWTMQKYIWFTETPSLHQIPWKIIYQQTQQRNVWRDSNCPAHISLTRDCLVLLSHHKAWAVPLTVLSLYLPALDTVRRGWFGSEVQCLSVHVPLSSEHRQTLLLHPLPSSREICSEEPSHKSKPSSQKSKQEKAGRAADWRACQCTLKYLLIANLLSHCAASSCSDSREMSDEFQIELITSSLGCPGKKRQQQHHHWFCFLFFLPFLFPHSIGVICSA